MQGKPLAFQLFRWFQFVANQHFHGCCVQSQLQLVLLSLNDVGASVSVPNHPVRLWQVQCCMKFFQVPKIDHFAALLKEGIPPELREDLVMLGYKSSFWFAPLKYLTKNWEGIGVWDEIAKVCGMNSHMTFTASFSQFQSYFCHQSPCSENWKSCDMWESFFKKKKRV